MAQLISWVSAKWNYAADGDIMEHGDLHQIIFWGGGLTEVDVVTFMCHPDVKLFQDDETVLQVVSVQSEVGMDEARRIFVWVKNVGAGDIFGYSINGMLLRP